MHPPGPLARFLSADHDRLDALFRRATRGDGPLDAEAFDEFRRGLLRHIGMEEKVLLPTAARARGGAPLPEAARLRRDHSDLATLLVPTPDRLVAETVRRILEPHNVVEEGPDGVYAAVDALLGDAAAAAVVEELRARPDPPVAAYSDNPRVLARIRALAAAHGVTGG